MMERHLTTSEHWRLWLELCAARPSRAAELDARASLLFERSGAHPEALVRTMLAAARIEDGIEGVRLADAAPRFARWGALVVLLALAGGWATSEIIHSKGAPSAAVAWRGADDAARGTIRIEQGGRQLAEVAVGRGVRPLVSIGPGALVVRSTAGAERTTLAWWVDSAGQVTGVTRVDAVAELVVPADAESLIVLIAPSDADVDSLVRTIGDGRRAVEPLGSAEIVAFDLIR